MNAEDVDAVDEGDRSDLDLMVEWARTTTATPVHEGALPTAARAALDALRAKDPRRIINVLAFRTLSDGVETARMGPATELPPDEALIALSVVTTEVIAAQVSVVGHVIVAQFAD